MVVLLLFLIPFCCFSIAKAENREDRYLREYLKKQEEVSILFTKAKYEKAAKAARRAMEYAEWAFGKEDIRYLESMYILGLIFIGQGRYEEADSLLRKTLKLVEEVGDWTTP